MIGFFIVERITGSVDAAGYSTAIEASSKMDMNIKCRLFLPPYLRKSQCGIGIGDNVFGVVDDVTGLGVALYGEGTADFGYFFDADVQIKQNLTVKNNIKSTSGDVQTATVSLNNHIHQLVTIPTSDCALIVAGAQGTGAILTTTYTQKP